MKTAEGGNFSPLRELGALDLLDAHASLRVCEHEAARRVLVSSQRSKSKGRPLGDPQWDHRMRRPEDSPHGSQEIRGFAVATSSTNRDLVHEQPRPPWPLSRTILGKLEDLSVLGLAPLMSWILMRIFVVMTLMVEGFWLPRSEQRQSHTGGIPTLKRPKG